MQSNQERPGYHRHPPGSKLHLPACEGGGHGVNIVPNLLPKSQSRRAMKDGHYILICVTFAFMGMDKMLK